MKINWGTGIVIAFISFIAFIGYFVVRVNIDGSTDHELVTKEYYKQELAYQKQIDAKRNALAYNAGLAIEPTGEGLLIQFPEQFDATKISGKVSLYRPSNRHLDFDLTISLSNSHLLIPDKRLLDGRWDISVAWHYNEEAFLHEQKIIY